MNPFSMKVYFVYFVKITAFSHFGNFSVITLVCKIFINYHIDRIVKSKAFKVVLGQINVCIVFSIQFYIKIHLWGALGDVSPSSKLRLKIWEIFLFCLKIWPFSDTPGIQCVNNIDHEE